MYNYNDKGWLRPLLPYVFFLVLAILFACVSCTMKVRLEPEIPFVLEAKDGTPFPLFHSKVNWCPITKDWTSAIIIHYNQVFGVITNETQLANFKIPKIMVTTEMFELLINWLIVRKVRIVSWQKIEPKLKKLSVEPQFQI